MNNKYFSLLLALFIISSIHCGQDHVAYLVKADFLTVKGQNELMRAPDHTSKESIIAFCYQAIAAEFAYRLQSGEISKENKIRDKEPLVNANQAYSNLFGRVDNKGFISANTSVVGYTRSKTLQTFYAAGLINDVIFHESQQALTSNKITNEVELLAYMLERSIYYSQAAKNKQFNYINRLAAHGILTAEEKASLLRSYHGAAVKSVPEILQYSSRFILVDLHAYKPQPAVTYPVIFEAIKRWLPAFDYKDLQIELIEGKESDLIRQDIKLSFTVGGDSYSHIFFHDFYKPGETGNDAARVDQEFHKGINKWLTDIASPFRLYTVNIKDADEQAYGERSVGLLLLKTGEDSLIADDGYAMSKESFDTLLSKKNILRFIDDLNEYGFFKHLTKKEIDIAKEQVRNATINSLSDVLVQFPRTVVVFDWETGNLENPYEELTKAFMDASRGGFKVTGIVDGFNKKGAYGFTMNGRRYEKMLDFKEDWLDPAFMELLGKACVENKVDGKIYTCINDGQVGGYIFLTGKQYAFIKEKYPDLLTEELE